MDNTQNQEGAHLTAQEEQTPAQTQTPAEPAKTPRGHLHYVLEAEKQLEAEKEKADTPAGIPQPKKNTLPAGKEPKQAPAQSALEDNALQAPKNWSEQDKAAFATLQDEGKKILLSIHKNLLSGWNKKMQTLSEQHNDYARLEQSLAPFVRGRFDSLDAFTHYLRGMQNMEAQLAKDPLHTLAVMAQQAGVNLADLSAYSFDPHEERARDMQAQLSRIERELFARQQAQQTLPPAVKEDETAQNIESFATAKDDNGALLHPHFARVAPLMGAIMANDESLDLQKAYDTAVLTLPEVQQAAQQAAGKKAQEQAQRAAELEKAKKAAALKTRTTPAPLLHAAGKKKTPLDYILEAEQQLSES